MNERTANAAYIRSVVTDGLFIAMVFAATIFINIRLPIAANGGLIHLGNVPLMVGAALFGKRTGALCGAFGMALFDLVSGWASWAPFTFVIVGLMGYAMGAVAHKANRFSAVSFAAALIIATVIKVVGYYFAEVFLYHNWIAPFSSIPGNLVQMGAAAVAAFIITPMLYQLVKNK